MDNWEIVKKVKENKVLEEELKGWVEIFKWLILLIIGLMMVRYGYQLIN